MVKPQREIEHREAEERQRAERMIKHWNEVFDVIEGRKKP